MEEKIKLPRDVTLPKNLKVIHSDNITQNADVVGNILLLEKNIIT